MNALEQTYVHTETFCRTVGAAIGRRDDAVRELRSRTERHAHVSTCPGHPAHRYGTRAEIIVERPLSGPLASRGVVIIPYCAQNMHIAPVFGAGALAVSPRVGHIHVTVDDAPWHWADASGNPLILRGLPPGPHTVLIELVDANHQPVDKVTVRFVVPKRAT